jgi:hypothetical protein
MCMNKLTGIDLPRGAKIGYDHKADVYSFAITLWSLIKNETPFKDKQGIIAAYGAIRRVCNSLLLTNFYYSYKFLLLLYVSLHNLLIDFN